MLLQINESINSGIKCIWDLLQSSTFLLKLLPCSLAFRSSKRTYTRKKRKERESEGERKNERNAGREEERERKKNKGNFPFIFLSVRSTLPFVH